MVSLLVTEQDESGNLCHQYNVVREGTPNHTITHISPKKPYNVRTLAEIFLPSGFPTCVTPDYIRYQQYNALQAFCSSSAGLLASRAVLEGFGVGDQNASSTHAMLLTVAQDASSRLATIMFAWRLGTALEPEAKMYRLAADVLLDGAIILDYLSPAVPPVFRVGVLCLSGSLRALCGVAAGGAKAALTAHFAKAGNVGDLNAKGASQETIIGLLGMLVKLRHCPRLTITSRRSAWVAVLVLLALHIATNYLAVRSVIMTTLNRQRANIVYSVYRDTGVVPTPAEVSRLERIFETDGALRDARSNNIVGFCKIGSSIVAATKTTQETSNSSPASLSELVQLFTNEQFLLWFDPHPTFPRRNVYHIWTTDKPTSRTHLKAWVLALEIARQYRSKVRLAQELTPLAVTRSALEDAQRIFPAFSERLDEAGWDLTVNALATTPLRIVSFASQGEPVEHKKNI